MRDSTIESYRIRIHASASCIFVQYAMFEGNITIRTAHEEGHVHSTKMFNECMTVEILAKYFEPWAEWQSHVMYLFQ